MKVFCSIFQGGYRSHRVGSDGPKPHLKHGRPWLRGVRIQQESRKSYSISGK